MQYDPQDFQRKLASLLAGEAVDGSFVQELRERYPFFTLPDALMLRRASEAGLPMPEGEELKRLLARLSLNSCDAGAASRLVNGETGSVEEFYPPLPEKETPTTESAIDTFLSSYGSRSDEEDALLERLIFNPVPDYALTMEAEEEIQPEAIPAAAPVPPPVPASESAQEPTSASTPVPASGPAPAPAPSRKPREAAGNPALLSESLAKIFIKTHRYDKAYEILERLSLEFPEKSRYFADQLRFLRKLILIQEHRRKQGEAQSE